MCSVVAQSEREGVPVPGLSHMFWRREIDAGCALLQNVWAADVGTTPAIANQLPELTKERWISSEKLRKHLCSGTLAT